MNYHLYILYSKSKDRYYIGSSEDPGKRLTRHNAGATKSTKPGRPWKIVYTELFENKSEVLKREKYLKKMKSRVLIENLIKSS